MGPTQAGSQGVAGISVAFPNHARCTSNCPTTGLLRAAGLFPGVPVRSTPRNIHKQRWCLTLIKGTQSSVLVNSPHDFTTFSYLGISKFTREWRSRGRERCSMGSSGISSSSSFLAIKRVKSSSFFCGSFSLIVFEGISPPCNLPRISSILGISSNRQERGGKIAHLSCSYAR
jgi:hypothetical protein